MSNYKKTYSSPRIKVIQKVYSHLLNPGEKIDYPKSQYKKFIKDVVEGTLERQEFTLDDNQSREFQVMYFGLGAAYFVNESGTVAGYGKPTSQGWQWTRSDSLAREISTGVDMLNNRAMPRFLELPVISPERIDQ